MRSKLQIETKLKGVKIMIDHILQHRNLTDNYEKKMEYDTDIAFLQQEQVTLEWVLNIKE